MKSINTKDHHGAYQATGSGPAVVLIHGFPENSHVWKHQQACLQEQFRVIAPDLPGSGGSPLTDPLTMDSMADFVYAILLAEGIEKAVVIGHSMGGYVALALAEQHPELIQGLGLFHSTAAPDSDEKKEGRRKSIHIMEQYGSEAFIRQTLPNMFSPVSRAQHPEYVADYIQMGMECQQASLIAYYRAMMDRPDRRNVLQSIAAPVLFIIGKDDNAVPPDSILPQVSLPRTSSIHIFEGTGHMGMWEVADPANHALQQFIHFCQGY